MSDPLKIHGVLESHIEGTLSVLKRAYGYHLATDLRKQYEAGKPNVQYSQLTRQLEAQITRFEGYLEESNDGPESEDPVDG